MAIFNSYVKLPTGAELATHWFHHPSARGFPCHNNSDVLRILLSGVSFRVYVSYKIPRPHGTYTHTSIRGFIQGLHKL